MTYYAIIHFDYATPAEFMKGDFGKNEFARYKKRADRAEILKEQYSPFPSIIPSHDRRTALLYFKTKEKFDSFKKYMEEREEKTGEFFGRSYKYNVEVA